MKKLREAAASCQPVGMLCLVLTVPCAVLSPVPKQRKESWEKCPCLENY